MHGHRLGRNLAGAALLVACMIGTARAEDRIVLRANHAAGDVITFQSASYLRMGNSTTTGGMRGPPETTVSQTARAGRIVVLEAANGLVTKASVTYDKSSGGFADGADGKRKNLAFPLAGQAVVVTVDPDGSIRADRTLTKEAVSDLELNVPVNTAFFPARPVKVGDSWDISGEILARSMSMPEGSTCAGQAQLAAVEDLDGRRVARVDVRLSFSGQTRSELSTFVADVAMEGTVWFDLKTGRGLRSSLIGRITTSTEYAMISGTVSNGEGELRIGFAGVLTREEVPVAPPPRNPGPNPLDQPPGPAADFSGTFGSDALTLKLAKSENGYRGTIIAGDRQFPATAVAEGRKLSGQFTAGDSAFPFDATLDGDTLTLKTGTTTYTLKKRPAAVNPLDALR